MDKVCAIHRLDEPATLVDDAVGLIGAARNAAIAAGLQREGSAGQADRARDHVCRAACSNRDPVGAEKSA